MNYEEAMELLEKYLSNKKNIISHCIAVSDFAYKTAKKIKKKGINIDIEKVRVAALLHDIGRINGPDNHSTEGGKILRNMGKWEIAEIIERHGSAFEATGNKDFIPKAIEDKVIVYADSRVDADRVVSFEERIASLRRRYSGERLELMERTVKRNEKIVKEIDRLLNK